MRFIRNLRMQGLLSFPPDTQPFELQDLNVLIGPNGSGKSNITEAIGLVRATATDFAAAIRDGGGAAEWFWKGEGSKGVARIEIETGDRATGLKTPNGGRALRYCLEFGTDGTRVEVLDEAIEEASPFPGHDDPYFYYRFQRGRPAINAGNRSGTGSRGEPPGRIKRHELRPDQSVLAQIRNLKLYPELTWLGRQFGQIQVLRDWTFGRRTAPDSAVGSSRGPAASRLPQSRPDSQQY